MRICITFVADPNPAFHFNADPDPALHFNADPNPAPHQPATTGLQALQGSIFILRASIVSVHGPPRLHFELLNLSFNADLDLDPAFHTDADPDPQPCFKDTR
jgi:hypothetical protein